MATSDRPKNSPPTDDGEMPDEPNAPIEVEDDSDASDYFFWGINELYVAP